MSEGFVLSQTEVQDVTGHRRRDAQRRALEKMGLRYSVRPNGSLAVLRAHANAVMGLGAQITIQRREPEVQP